MGDETYSKIELGGGGAGRKGGLVTVGGGVVDLGEAEGLVGVVGDGEALEEVGELAGDVEKGLVSGFEEGAVPGAGSTGKLVARLYGWLALHSVDMGVCDYHRGYVPCQWSPASPCSP